MSESAFKRAHRVAQVLQQELGALIGNELKDPRVGFVTVTEVRPADDLRTARVFVSVYGTDEVRQLTIIGLQEAAGFLKRELARRVNMRFTPALTFVLDTTLDQAEHLDRLLDEAKRGSADIDIEGESESERSAPQAGEPLAEPVPVKTARSELAERAAELESQPAKKNRTQRSRGKAGRSGRNRTRNRNRRR